MLFYFIILTYYFILLFLAPKTVDAVDSPDTQSVAQASSSVASTSTPSTSSTQNTPQTSSSNEPRPNSVPSKMLLRMPAVRFLLRPDFFNVLHMNDDALSQYNSTPSLKHMVTKIRRDGQQGSPAAFDRYQHNRDLVSLINKFAESNKELPPGN